MRRLKLQLAILLILTGCASTSESIFSTPQIADIEDKKAAIREYAEQYVDFGSFDGVVLVAEGEQVVVQEAFGFADYRYMTPVTAETRFRIASLSKQFTQDAIGRLVARGKLKFDSKISEFIPDFPNGDRITILQLLDYTSGIKHTNDLGWISMKEPLLLSEIIDGLAKEPLDFDPGTARNYSNGAYAVAAAVIESATGMSYADFLLQEFAERYPSIGHEYAYEVVPFMAYRYAPAAKFGERVEATQYLVANRIGGGSVYAAAEDVYRFFRSTFSGEEMHQSIYEVLFSMPQDGDTRITGRSPGALAQVYYDINEDLTVVTLSSNSSWPGSFNSDITALYRGDTVVQTPVIFSDSTLLSLQELAAIPGTFEPERFSWTIKLERDGNHLVYIQDEMRTAFRKTKKGDFYLPIWDWLCSFNDGYQSFVCRQRDPSSESEFVFNRVR